MFNNPMRRASGILSKPPRGEGTAFSAGCREESLRHSLRAVERGASGIRRVLT